MRGLHTGGSDQPHTSEDDNRANQLNPNHDAYWQPRGEAERPVDWKDQGQSGQED